MLGALIPAVILGAAVVIGVLAPWLAPHSPSAVNLRNALETPSWSLVGTSAGNYVLGTDYLGRDVLSRLIIGTRLTLLSAGLGLITASSVGTVLGIVAGCWRGKVESLVMGAVDVSLALPALVIALAFAVALGPGLSNIIVVINLVYWSRFARQAHAETISVMGRPFILASHAIGASVSRILIRHVLPNITSSLVVLGSLILGQVIVLEATLSFLGVGVPPPAPSWGNMVSEGRGYVADAPWMIIPPGLAILVLVLAANLLGDWLRDRLDPRLRGGRVRR